MSGTGEVLVSYLVESDDDEGPQASAWRLYDGERVLADGHAHRVSEASASPGLWALEAGFLLQRDPARQRYEVLGVDGTLTPATRSPEPLPVEPGDLQLDDYANLVFRPSTGTVFAAPRSPAGRSAQGQAVDETGGVWVLGEWGDELPVLHSADGGSSWERVPISLPRDAHPLGIAVAGDRVVVPLAGLDEDGGERLLSLQVRDVAAPGAEPWRAVPAQVGAGEQWFGADVGVLPDGRLLLSGWDQPGYAVPLDGGAWEPLALPDVGGDVDGWSVRTAGGRLYALSWRLASAYTSDDLGETWDVLPR